MSFNRSQSVFAPHSEPTRHFRRPGVASSLLAVALVSALLTWTVPRGSVTSEQPDALMHSHQVPGRTAAQQGLREQMRKLWEDHITWTRLAIVTFADGSAGFPATASRLLQNQVDIGDALKPFFGEPTGDRLTALLRDHITIAVEIL